jgi:hypothetical protein
MYPVSARFLDVLTGSHRAIVRARLFTSPQVSSNPVGGTELPVSSGNVKMTSGADVKATLELEVPGEYWEIVQPYSGEIFVERGIDFGDGTSELVPLGWYRITKSSQQSQPSGAVRIQASDRTVALQQNRVLYPFQVPTGYTHRQLFERLVNGRVVATDPLNSLGYAALLFTAIPITWVAYDPDRYTVDGGQTVEDSTYDFMAKLADDKGAVLRFDEAGGLVVDVAGRDPDTAPVYVVQPGVNGNLIDASRETSREATYNIVVAYGSDPAFPTGYQIAYNTDPNSPLRWDGPFGPAPRYYASPLLRDANAAAQAAATVLSKYTGLPTTQGIWTVPNPALRPLDMLSARIVGLPVKHLVDEITIPLAGSEPVEITTKTAASVVEPTPGSTNPGGTPTPDVGFTQAQIDQEKAFEITSTAENSTLAWWENYRYIEDGAGIGDDRGYTAGLVGFTSATGDMDDLIRNYLVPDNPTSPLASFLTGLATCASVGQGPTASSTANTNLGTSFQNAWRTAADNDAVFRKAQRDYRSDNYWDPAFAQAQTDGLRALGTALYYDTYVNHGPGEPGSGDGSFEDIRSSVTLPGGSGGGVANVGNTANGTGASSSTANKTVVSKFTAGSGGTLDAGHARLWVDAGTASIELVVYADSSGVPGALLAKSNTVAVSNTAEADKTFAFSGTQRIALVSGTAYWIGFTWADPGTNTISWSRGTTTSQAQQNALHAASAFGTPGTALSGPIDAYVTLAASGGSAGSLSDADATTYLNAFLDARSAVLTAWGDNPADGRIHMFRDLVASGNFTLHTPFSWSVYGDAFQLAQDPTPRDVPGTTPTTPGDTNTGFTAPGPALNIRKADGGNHFNIGVAYAANNPFGSSPVHHDYSMAEIEGGLNLPGHYELMPNGNVRYTVPLDGGRTSENTKYPRVEHRGLNPDNSKQAFNKGTAAYIKARVKPIKVPPNKPEWVPLQFHDADDDVAMIHVHDNLVRAKIKGEYIGTLTSSWDKTMTDGKIEVLKDGTVNFYWGSLTTPALTSTQWTGGFTGWYGKIGAYSQSWGGSGTRGSPATGPTDDVADGPLIVETDPSAFEMWQDGWAKPARLTPPSTGGTGGTGGTGSGTGGSTPSTGFHADLYVATTGSDSNAGTSASSPKATIAAAISAASAGQTISVASGTYTGNITVSHGGSSAGYITVRSATPKGAKISGSGAGTQAAVQIDVPYVRFQDFEITGTLASGVRYGVSINASNVEIKGCLIHQVCKFETAGTSFQGGAGINFDTSPLSNISLDANEIHDIGPGVGVEQLVHGIYCGVVGTNFRITNNLIYDCEDFGVHCYPTSSSSGIQVVNNTIVGCGRGILQGKNGITRNNIVFNCGSPYDIRESGNVLSNNFSGGTGDVTGISGVKNGTNPQFVRLATDGTGDFHLQSSSACINAGTATGAPGADFAGQTRPWGAGIDAGAFEYVATSTGGGSTTPPASDDGTQAAVVLGWGPVIDGDEFDYSGPPRSDKWSMYDGPGHDGNGIRSPSAFNVANGVLTCYGDNTNGGTTGGMAFDRETKYVRIEWRVRTYSVNPQGNGNRYHPVLIMWPTSDRWPQDGEYDFFECDCDSGKYEHFEHIPGNDGSAQEYDSFPLDIQNYHNYAFEWSKTGIKGFVDGKKVWEYNGSYILAPGTMHPTMQLDNFHGSNMEPAKFESKWVRIYASPS